MKKRQPTRLQDYDYASPGAYFITLCTKDKKNILGRIVEEKTVLSVAGEVVMNVWMDLPQHCPLLELDEFVIIPNHVHDILWLHEKNPRVGAGLKPSPTQPQKKHPLSEIVRAFKTLSSRRINQLNRTPSQTNWQRSFYDHVVRDEKDLLNHRKYILENPVRWTLDEYYQVN